MSHHDKPLTLLGDLTPADFLAHYWQQKPLLIRGAIPDFVSPIDPDELAGLACEPGVEARLVEEDGPDGPGRYPTVPSMTLPSSASPKATGACWCKPSTTTCPPLLR